MTQFYIDPEREGDAHALPDAEVFYTSGNNNANCGDGDGLMDAGWYWWPCFPGCLPDGDPIGPFETEEAAIEDARSS